MEVIPLHSELFLKQLFRILGHGVLQGTIVDAGIYSSKGESRFPSTHLAIPNAIFKEVSRIQHMRVPYHQDI
jgi:hypothetical protein